MARPLPSRPNLEWLRKTAKDRLSQLRTIDPTAKLADAQLAVAREYGFPSWRKLKAHVDQIGTSTDLAAFEATIAEFLRHVGTGHIDEVRAALAGTARIVNAIGPHPFWGGRAQAVHVAIEARRKDLFDLLLDHGADVNGSNDQYEYWSPLMIAIDRNEPDMIDALRRRGARVELLEALMLGDDDRVEELLRPGKLPDIAPKGGSILAFARTPFAIDRLIALGAPTDLKDRWGATPIDAISRLGPRGHRLLQHMVARGVAAAPKEYARLGDFSTLWRVVESDPSIARHDAVMLGAVDFGHHAIVRWLLEGGANANARSDAKSRHTALHSAAWNGDLEMVKLLVEAGADYTARDEQYDGTPLDWAQTSIEVSNNPRCADVVSYLQSIGSRTDERS